jgi:hypothetical protein
MLTFFVFMGGVAFAAFMAAAFGPSFMRKVEQASTDVKIERIRQELLKRHAERERAALEARAKVEAETKAEVAAVKDDAAAYANKLLAEDK